MSQFAANSGRMGSPMEPQLEGKADGDEPQAPQSRYLDSFGINAGFVEEVEAQYRIDERSVDESWSAEFGGAGRAGTGRASGETLRRAPMEQRAVAPSAQRAPIAAVAPVLVQGSTPAAAEAAVPVAPANSTDAMLLHTADKHARVLRLIHAYRARGHRIAQFDPLGAHSTYFPELDPAHYGFGNEHLDELFIAGDLPGGSVQTLRQILSRLSKTYCGPIGVEFTHVQDPARRTWLREQMEEGPESSESRRRGPQAHPRESRGGGALRELPPHEVPGSEALLARGR